LTKEGRLTSVCSGQIADTEKGGKRMVDTVNYVPGPTDETMEEARVARYHCVAVHVFARGGAPGGTDGMHFVAITPYLPRIGEVLRLEEGRRAKVEKVFWKVGKLPSGTTAMYPHVGAFLVDDDG
jgi:hypothetical protein